MPDTSPEAPAPQRRSTDALSMEQAMALFTSRREFYTSLISGLVAMAGVISLVIVMTTSSTANGVRLEVQKPIADITTRVHDVESQVAGNREQVVELDKKFTEQIAGVSKRVDDVQVAVKDSEKAVRGELQTQSGKLDRIMDLMLTGKVTTK